MGKCRFCGRIISLDEQKASGISLWMICGKCRDWKNNTDPPRGGRAAGTTFEEEPEEMALAVGK